MNLSIHSQINRVERIADAVHKVFGDSAKWRIVSDLCRVARQDLEDIANQRGVSGVVVSVIGHKNAGKSTLCRLLVNDEGPRGRIKIGDNSENATLRITWIGPGFPNQLDPGVETVVPVLREHLEDLGAPYTLVDVPGSSDSDVSAKHAAERALRMASTAILVTDWRSLEKESVLGYLQKCEGARILPVVVASAYKDKLSNPKTTGDLSEFCSRIRQWCPNTEVLEPLLVPLIDEAGNDTKLATELESIARKQLADALREVIRKPPTDPSRLASGRFGTFQSDVRQELESFLGNVKPHYEALISAEAEAAHTISEQLIGDERQLAAGIRVRMLASLVDRCPILLFPFRSFLGLLTLAAGAWDRLILGIFGSLPSLAMIVVQSGKNAQKLSENRRIAHEDLLRRSTAIVTGHLAPSNRRFLRSVRESLPEDARSRLDDFLPEVNLSGLEQLESESIGIFESRLTELGPKGVISFILGLASMVIWIALASGPVWSIYDEYFGAWGFAFDGTGPGKWNKFPVPDADMVFSTLVLVFAPVFLMAMVALGVSVTSKRIRLCASRITKETRESMQKQIATGVIRLRSDDKIKAAVKTLLIESGCSMIESSLSQSRERK